MTGGRWMWAILGVVLLATLVVAVNRVLERMFVQPATLSEPVTQPGPEAATPHITATLFYATADGEALTPVQREVPLANEPAAQGRAVLEAQMAAAPEGLVSVIPSGTTVRGFYITARQDAFVDLSAEAAAHPGGSTFELLTVYAIVNAVTANLPSVQRVQILIDGKEVDTLAGHVDLRRPLERDTALIRGMEPPQ